MSEAQTFRSIGLCHEAIARAQVEPLESCRISSARVMPASKWGNTDRRFVMKHVENLVELYQWSCEQHADRPMLGTRTQGNWTWITYRQFRSTVEALRAGLASLGVSRGDRVAFIGDNSVEWAAAAYATYGLGAAFVPMYQAQRPAEWEFILADCAARVVFVANEKTFDGARGDAPAAAGADPRRRPDPARRPTPTPGTRSSPPARRSRSRRSRPIRRRSPASSTRRARPASPRARCSRHRNIVSNIARGAPALPALARGALSLVPAVGALVRPDRRAAHAPELRRVAGDQRRAAAAPRQPRRGQADGAGGGAAHLQPDLRGREPRDRRTAWARCDASSRTACGARSSARAASGSAPVERLELAFDEQDGVPRRSATRFGGRLRYVFSGSATLSQEVAEFIDALGITGVRGLRPDRDQPDRHHQLPARTPLRQRRTGPPRRARRHRHQRHRRTSREGEIVVYGPNVMLGYHHRPEENERGAHARRRPAHRRSRLPRRRRLPLHHAAASRSSTSSRTASTSCRRCSRRRSSSRRTSPTS